MMCTQGSNGTQITVYKYNSKLSPRPAMGSSMCCETPCSHVDIVIFGRSEKLNKCTLLGWAHSTRHDLVWPSLSLMDPLPCPAPKVLTASESFSVPPSLCTCSVCILPQLSCFEDVSKLHIEISQLLLPPAWVGWTSSSIYLPRSQKSYCWAITVLFPLLCTLALSSSRAGTGYLGSPAQHCMWFAQINVVE